MILAHADPGLVASHVIDTIGDRLAARVGREIVNAYGLRRALRLPFTPAVLEVPDQLFLLRIDRDHWLATLQEAVGGRIDVLKLVVAVGVRRAFVALARRLQAVPQIVEHAADRRRADGPPVPRQRCRQLRATLTRPAQGRRRVSACQRIDQRLQDSPQVRLLPLVRAPRAWAAHASGGRPATRAFQPTLPNGLPCQAGRRRHQGSTPIADGPRLGRRPHPATPLVQHRRDGGVLHDHGGFQVHVSLHASSRPENCSKMGLLF